MAFQEQHCTQEKHCGPRAWYSLFISLWHSVHVQFHLNLVLPKPDQPYCLLRLRPCCLLITWMFNFRVSWQGGDGLVDAHELWGFLSLHPQCVLLVRRLIIYKVHKQGKIQCLCKPATLLILECSTKSESSQGCCEVLVSIDMWGYCVNKTSWDSRHFQSISL